MQLSDFPGTERDDGCVFTLNNKAYCFSGLDVNFQCQTNGFIFDGTSESWSNGMASLPVGKERQYATAFSYSNTGYMLGGINCSNVCLNDFWQYNSATNTWSALPDFPASGRQGMCNFILNNKAYIIGGRDAAGNVFNEVWEYSFATATWSQKSNLPFAGTWRGAAFEINGIGYTCFGLRNDNGYNRNVYQYDDTNDTWQLIPNINLPALRYIGCAITSNKAFMYGGMDSLNQISNTVHLFTPTVNTVATYSGIPTFARKGGIAFALNNKFYFTTGVTLTARVKETWKNDQFVGVEKNYTEAVGIDLFPNPTNSTITLKGNNLLGLTILNPLGQIVLYQKLHSSDTAVDLNILPPAIYFVFIDTKEGIFQTKIVVRKE